MADLLNLGTTALLSLQRAINTTGNNIANVNTPGYSRQRVNMETLPSQFNGGNYLGNGVRVDSIERSYDQFLTAEVRSRTSSQRESATYYDLSSRLDSVLADPAVGLSGALNGFFGALQDVANNPGSLPERQALLGQSQVLADRFGYLDDRFRDLEQELNGRIEATVAEINTLSQGIADLNKQLVQASASTPGQAPNDLLDARDQLLAQLAEKISVTTIEQSDGALNVMIGNGQALVVGFTAEQLQTSRDPFDGTAVQVGVVGPAGTSTSLGRFLSGGELGAMFDFRDQQLNPARDQLGLTAVGLASSFNAQHSAGLDLNGLPGADFFNTPQPTYAAQQNNAGLATLDVSLSDVSALTGDNYSMRYEAGNWTLTNRDSGASQTGPGPFTVDGIEIAVTGGAPVDGDVFLVQPTRQAAGLFALALARPEDIAAGSPLRSGEELANIGSAALGSLSADDPGTLPLAGRVTLAFDPDALGPGVPGFNVAGIAGGPLAYDPTTDAAGADFTLGGFSFSVSGTPQAGDQLFIENNANGSGDNSNALALADLQTARSLLGGTASFQDTYSRMVTDVAVRTSQAETGMASESVLLEQAIADRDSVAGVNLDEEAANLIRYQQAYQAAAQVISVADQLFQTLLNATRR
ncbi:flagellar hook-associated protein FlgK [Pseudohalioglobus lutimaris]|uniref:Flagellar hook-associated protein 1 n=1 Tax=Pseudohalioglobus lutimaris TaxID=1737061 RepID=A0A2N5X1C1_9GAMM|nr:flagellar hook-associated protein FlgK [Pseudohalioglobus lutimaris]PLW68283.1 flagellar hook-associated protein FlgK [Pseudohalioglobus lutimaris]